MRNSASFLSFREKSAWISLVATVAVFLPYFVHVFRLARRGSLTAPAVLQAFIAAVIVQVILLVAASVVIALRSRQEPKDERDVAIESKSFRNAYWVFSFLSITAIGSLIVLALAPTAAANELWLAPAFLAQIFLLCFVLAEVTKQLTQVVCYRRGC
jgi:hypothetical protein